MRGAHFKHCQQLGQQVEINWKICALGPMEKDTSGSTPQEKKPAVHQEIMCEINLPLTPIIARDTSRRHGLRTAWRWKIVFRRIIRCVE